MITIDRLAKEYGAICAHTAVCEHTGNTNHPMQYWYDECHKAHAALMQAVKDELKDVHRND